MHNVRIERLWGDVTVSFGAKWADIFTELELQHGMDINNRAHTWLLHELFLPDINADADFFVETWNNHSLQIRGEANRSPVDLFGFDMAVHGDRGDPLEEEDLDTYGVDWSALQERHQFADEEVQAEMESPQSWVGHTGPPPNLSHVEVEEVDGPLTAAEQQELHQRLSIYPRHSSLESVTTRWTQALAWARTISNEF